MSIGERKSSAWWRGRFGLGWCLVALGLCNALLWSALRWRHEKSLGTVAIAVDFDDVRVLADAARVPRVKLLRALKGAGATHIALDEQSLVLLRAAGRLSISPREEALRLFPSLAPSFGVGQDGSGSAREGLLVWSRDEPLMRSIEPRLRDQSPRGFSARAVELAGVRGRGRGVIVAASAQLLNDASMGLDPAQVAQARESGLKPIPVLSNHLNTNARRIAEQLDEARNAGARLVLLDDTEALGYASLLDLVALEARARGLGLGAWEFSNQRGQDDLAEASAGFLVRAHIVSPKEAEAMAPEVLADRYARAARERNVRVLYVRLLRHLARFKAASTSDSSGASKLGEADVVKQNAAFIALIRSGLGESPAWARSNVLSPLSLALRPGEPSLFGDFPGQALSRRLGSRAPVVVPLIVWAGLFLGGLGALGACLLVANLLLDLSSRAQWTALCAGALLAAGLATRGASGAKMLAFAAACAFPLVALAWSGLMPLLGGWALSARSASTWGASQGASASLSRQSWVCAARLLGLSLVGGFVVAGLLSDWRFASGAAGFWGTKPAQIFPLLLGMLLVCGRFEPRRVQAEGAGPAQERARRAWGTLLEESFTLRSALLAGVAGLGLLLWIARSGNDAGVSVSPLEWKLRAALEHALIARPRNKELFFAYPSLVLGLWCARRGLHNVAPALGVVAFIAPIDVLNSFAQANNPLALALWRSVGGALLGTGLGLGLASCFYTPRQHRERLARARTRALQVLARPRIRRLALAVVLLGSLGIGLKRWREERRYAWLAAPSPEARWPWPGARREELGPGVSHWIARASDGTSLELLQFDLSSSSGLRLGLYDQDQDDDKPFDNRAAYWKQGLAKVASHLDGRSRGGLVAVFNGSFFGLLNERPRERDRAFHLSPLVVDGRAHYAGTNHRWTLGLERASPARKYLQNPSAPQARLRVLHLPSAKQLGNFEWAVGSAQCVLLEGRALEVRPFPRPGEAPLRPPVPSTPREAGHIPVLDAMKTSRVSVGWSRDGRKLWLLFVKEPDGEDVSRAQALRSLPAYGGWRLDDVSRFWQSMRDSQNAWNALVLDGGDVAQLAFRRPGNRFELVPPRFSTPQGPATARYNAAPDGHDAPASAQEGGALTYLYVWRQKP